MLILYNYLLLFTSKRPAQPENLITHSSKKNSWTEVEVGLRLIYFKIMWKYGKNSVNLILEIMSISFLTL